MQFQNQNNAQKRPKKPKENQKKTTPTTRKNTAKQPQTLVNTHLLILANRIDNISKSN